VSLQLRLIHSSKDLLTESSQHSSQKRSQSHPYKHTDGKIVAWFNWVAQGPHASDWTYVVITELCPSADSPVVAFEADCWEAGLDAELSNQGQMRQWLDQISSDGLPRHTMYVIWLVSVFQLT
jgi:hypothetical protein